jgi:hypothetical protein
MGFPDAATRRFFEREHGSVSRLDETLGRLEADLAKTR